jgi:anhydro-N-acetylmuramic acid kinase
MIVVGVLSGTSADGITVAITEILHEQTEDNAKNTIPPIGIKQLAFETIPWPAAERELIFKMFSGSSLTVQQLCQANFQLGRAFADAVIKVVENNGFKLSDIDLIGSHGQTVWHDVTVENTVSSTLQIGEPAVIAEMTGVTTVADFRVADVAAGGHGAPLVPIFDSIMLGTKDKSDSWRAHQNIGGIGNVTLLPPTNSTEKPIGFDTGPGNVLMDWYASKITNGELQYDVDGKLAALGKVNEKLLQIMLNHPYFTTKPPKTTGRELFTFKLGEEWLAHKDKFSMTEHDFLATLTELTAVSIAKAYKTWCPGHLERVTVAGGGSHNPYLMKRIQVNIEKEFNPLTEVCSLDDNHAVSFNSEAKEALLFALLAWMAIHGYDSNVPSCTGAKGGRVLGKIIPGKNYTKALIHNKKNEML